MSTKIKRFSDYSLVESMVDDFINSFDLNEDVDGDPIGDDEVVEDILNRFKETFGDKTPSNQEFADFYHELRSDGIDGILIFQTLDGYLDDDNDNVENSTSAYKRIEKKVISDLKLDMSLVLTFGAGIGALYPVVHKMMSNLDLSSVELNLETVVLLTIASVTIVYLEEKKFKTPQEEDRLTKDSKSMLEELRMRGIGDGLVKKVIKAIVSIKNIFSLLGKHIGAVVGGVIDMFGYTAILIPVMNAILSIIGKYDMSVDAVIQNFFSLSMGIASRIAKHGLVELINKLKGFISNKKKEEIIDELETPVIQKFGDMTYGDSESDQEGELIKEQ
jgi:hypothetical protein